MQGGVRICDHRVVLSPSIPSFCDICPRMHATRSSVNVPPPLPTGRRRKGRSRGRGSGVRREAPRLLLAPGPGGKVEQTGVRATSVSPKSPRSASVPSRGGRPRSAAPALTAQRVRRARPSSVSADGASTARAAAGRSADARAEVTATASAPGRGAERRPGRRVRAGDPEALGNDEGVRN